MDTNDTNITEVQEQPMKLPKRVFDPKRKEIVIIDAAEEKDRQQKYYHWSWTPFVGVDLDVVQATITNMSDWGLASTAMVADLSEANIETLWAMYQDKLGKQVPVAYKNKRDWIISKLANGDQIV